MSNRSRISVARDQRFRRRSRAKRNPFAPRTSPPEIRIEAGFDSGRGDCGDQKGMGRTRCRGACCFIFASSYRVSSCWYFRWYQPPSMMKTILNSNGYGIRRLSARGTNRASAPQLPTFVFVNDHTVIDCCGLAQERLRDRLRTAVCAVQVSAKHDLTDYTMGKLGHPLVRSWMRIRSGRSP
jgi:hypothetical protein